MRRLLYCVLGLILACGFAPGAETHDEIAGKPDLVAHDASALKKTVVFGALQQATPEGKNIVWCSTLQLCWNELMKNEGGPVELQSAAELAKFLNEKLTDETQVDPAAVFTFAGSGPNAPAELSAKLQKHFGEQASPKLIPENVGAAETIFYSYLFRNLAFKNPFDPGDERPLYFKDISVKKFGVWPESKNWPALAKQVVIHDYRRPDDFVVELLTTQRNETLLIARLRPGVTLKHTINSVLWRLDLDRNPHLRVEDTFAVPMMNFELFAEFPELKSRISNSKTEGAALLGARQLIRFRLNEKGAILKSEALEFKEESKLEREEKPKPRHLICDGPFLIMMRKNGAKFPYFALWIDNTQLLLPKK